MSNILLQPYPMWDNKRNKIYLSIAISLLLFLVLFFFNPLGIEHIEADNDILVYTGYSLLCLLILLAMQFTLPSFAPSVFKEDKWKVYKEILYLLLIIIAVGTGLIFYSAWFGFIVLSTAKFFYYENNIITLTFFPVIVLVLAKQLFLFRRNRKKSRILSEKLYRKTRMPVFAQTIVNLLPETADEKFSVESKDIYYIAAADNRIEVQVKREDTVKQILLNNTIRNAHSSLKRFSNFYRCHRTYIVNLDKVASVTGNSQGLRLILFDTEKQIPVSRTLTKELTQRLSM